MAARSSLELATPDSLDDVLHVLDAAATWLADRGVEQWPGKFDRDNWRVAQLAGEAGRGNVVLLRVGGVPAATVTVTTWADPDFASAWPSPAGDALYVLRLARDHTVEPRAPLGSWLLNWAAERAIWEGRRYLRLDCSKTNTLLHRYYRRQGFDRVGLVDLAHRRSGALFQRDVRLTRLGSGAATG